jgi:hypothetical protein
MNARWIHVATVTALATFGLLALTLRDAPPEPTAPGVEAPVVEAAATQAPTAGDDELQGLWTRWPHDLGRGDPVRFYYFHGDGAGLYRYGRIGHTNTNSYRYKIVGGEQRSVELTFNKTGERYRVPFAVKMGRDGRKVLQLPKDPREGGAPHEYFYVPPPDLGSDGEVVADPTPPSGRMWICMQRYKTGGTGWVIYQLTPAGIDGRGTGWHHRGDFDDWSTESMTYRMENGRLELEFELTHERHVTDFALVEGEGGKRQLELKSDPRNWWHASKLADMGKSFDVGADPSALAKQVQVLDGALPTCR